MKKLVVLSVVLVFAGTASAQFFDDFESYADTAAMLAPGAWGDDSSTDAPATLATDNTQYMLHPGGKTAKHVIAPLDPANGDIVWYGDMYDDGASSNKRVTFGLRDNGAGAPLASLIEMGHYNSFTTPGGTGGGYGVRTVFLPGATGWVEFVNASTTQGTHHFEAVITATDITFTIDLLSDGSIDDTIVVAAASAGINHNVLRLGGPSDLSSAGGPVGFDNVGIYQIPEPASVLLLGLLALIRRR